MKTYRITVLLIFLSCIIQTALSMDNKIILTTKEGGWINKKIGKTQNPSEELLNYQKEYNESLSQLPDELEQRKYDNWLLGQLVGAQKAGIQSNRFKKVMRTHVELQQALLAEPKEGEEFEGIENYLTAFGWAFLAYQVRKEKKAPGSVKELDPLRNHVLGDALEKKTGLSKETIERVKTFEVNVQESILKILTGTSETGVTTVQGTPLGTIIKNIPERFKPYARKLLVEKPLDLIESYLGGKTEDELTKEEKEQLERIKKKLGNTNIASEKKSGGIFNSFTGGSIFTTMIGFAWTIKNYGPSFKFWGKK